MGSWPSLWPLFPAGIRGADRDRFIHDLKAAYEQAFVTSRQAADGLRPCGPIPDEPGSYSTCDRLPAKPLRASSAASDSSSGSGQPTPDWQPTG
jgi:hypothetical protein